MVQEGVFLVDKLDHYIKIEHSSINIIHVLLQLTEKTTFSKHIGTMPSSFNRSI